MVKDDNLLGPLSVSADTIVKKKSWDILINY